MDKKRSDNLSDLRRQRERIRRFAVVAFVAAGVAILGSCEGLTSRGAAGAPQVDAASPGTAAERRL